MMKNRKVFIIVLICILSFIITVETIAIIIMKNSSVNKEVQGLEKDSDGIYISNDMTTWYIRKYIGKNCAYVGNKDGYDNYGKAGIKLIYHIKGDLSYSSYISGNDREKLKNYVVVDQSIKPNTKLLLQLNPDNPVKAPPINQNIQEIELTIEPISNNYNSEELKTEEQKQEEIKQEEQKQEEIKQEEQKQEETKQEQKQEETHKDEEKKENNMGLRSDFKSAMDSYESFMNEYISFMKKYKGNPYDTSLLKDYSRYMTKYSDMMTKFEKWESQNLNKEEAAYYVEVQARVNKKLLEVM